jgi:protein phosphatase 1L
MDNSLTVSRSFGDFSFKQGAGGPEMQKLSAEPDITAVALDHNTEFAIIASDGVWSVLSNEAAVSLVRACFAKGQSAEDASKVLAQRCVAAEAEEGGVGQDNVTAAVVRFLPLPSSRSPSTSTAASST